MTDSPHKVGTEWHPWLQEWGSQPGDPDTFRTYDTDGGEGLTVEIESDFSGLITLSPSSGYEDPIMIALEEHRLKALTRFLVTAMVAEPYGTLDMEPVDC